jgi:6-phosphogluconolactonase
MILHVSKTPAEVIQSLAEFFIRTAQQSIEANGRFIVSLSGGSSPKALYELLAENYNTAIDWNKVYFFFGDERYVPADDDRYNGLMIDKALFDPLKIPAANIYKIDTSLDPAESAKDYESKITQLFGDADPAFDLMLLGLGDNSHTASLFPHTTILAETNALVKEVWVEEVGMYRISMTAPLINKSRNIVFFLFGKSKAPAVYNIIQREKNIDEYPAQLIHPVAGTLHWFMDTDAAADLK